MSTRSIIAKENADGTFTGIYCHWDGYPEHNGSILINHYTDDQKINQLLKLGDLSILGSEIGEKHPFESPDKSKYVNWCKAYGRDRGEKHTKATRYKNFDAVFNADCGQDYVYIKRQGNGIAGTWQCYDYNKKSVNLSEFKR